MEQITLAEAARRTGIPARTLRTWCMSGRLPSVAVTSRLRLVRLADLAGLKRPKRGNPKIAELRRKSLGNKGKKIQEKFQKPIDNAAHVG